MEILIMKNKGVDRIMNSKYAAVGLCEFCETHLKRAIVEIKEKRYEVCKICAGGVVGTKAGVLVTKTMSHSLRPTKEKLI